MIPVGMSIGPFSLLTKLLKDPITPIYMAGTGLEADGDDDVALLCALLKLSETIIHATCWHRSRPARRRSSSASRRPAPFLRQPDPRWFERV